MLRISRTNIGPVGLWWYTVDRWMLFGLILLGFIGLFFSLAVSPAEAISIKTDTYFFLTRHLIYCFISLFFLIVVSILPAGKIRKLSLIIFIGSLIGIFLTLTVGINSGGASRWLPIFGFTIQPSEFLKPSLVIVVSWFLARARLEGNTSLQIIPAILLFLSIFLLLQQPDVGQTILIIITVMGLMFFNGLPWKIVIGLISFSILGGIFLYFNFSHVSLRVDNWVNAWFNSDSLESRPTQMSSAIDAFENGGLFGQGIGEGWMKYNLPDAYTDFIFAAVAEEGGLFFILLIILIYGFIIIRGFSKIQTLNNYFNQLAASGLLLIFGLQTLFHMAVNLSLVPAKGMTLPFISYGGSSIMALGICMGMFLSLTKKDDPRIKSKNSDLNYSGIQF
ncbi:MAG: FtsW/RodA/SpoVE family cell cycle protein [Alphaproteobacteria bacterium]|nr:FtsW/RodA/SpoVE family cell cycle protein [Rhodobiaceae bacterium]PDH51036.1 MAG: cell division protein FtsW [alpha proteobacterium MED-G09]|tara:strand:+ start:10512 stop:11687 length:1176 start_codon:yes stop_codon:yes gene_type:complete